ncbi:hypothetical protein [Neptuniibacter sp.]|uniref:phage adaptor protein n=1 Tax=Neptuniibacter sp. TaxID=1962643 RepID=UPI00262C9D3B|nr:hypothetical protein [Neptuniibacter sp.]MCP4597053.1 hypothetical protein [Neptuniibacter sp.]
MAIVTQQTGQFSGYTLTELRALVLKNLRATNTVRYSPTGGAADYDWVDDALNRGQEDFVRETLCLATYAIVEMKANYRTYRLPWNFLDLEAAYFFKSSYTYGYEQLVITTHNELNYQYGDWRTATGNPKQLYVDRTYGNIGMFGLTPIPDTDGGEISFDSEYGQVVQWVCPTFTFASEYGVIIRMTDTDEFVMNVDTGVVAQAEEMDGNVFLEYYRFPEELIVPTEGLGVTGAQYPEIPREYQKALVYYATADLLASNPEDSAEYKRAPGYHKRFLGEIETYKRKRKKNFDGQRPMRRAAVWNWMTNMPHQKSLP